MRRLTDSEMTLVAGGTSEDIVVKGHRDDSGYFFFNTFQISADENRVAFDGGASTALTTGISVNVHVANQDNLAAAENAAENWASALAKIVDAATHVAASTPITLADGSTTTAGQLLSVISQTRFVMTDSSFTSTNGGVGAADHNYMTDSLDFRNFDNDGLYASPNYSNQQGMVGIALHETMHMSDQGYYNFQQEHYYFGQEMHNNGQPAGNADYFGSDYGFDDERFADVSAGNVASAIGLDISQYETQRDVQNGGHFDYEGAASIYFDHNTY